MIILLFSISIGLNFALTYGCWNMLKKNEGMEDAIQNFYSRLQRTLNTMRALDEKQMFEKDDEVGDVFSQITNTVNELRSLLYGSNNTDGTENEENTR